MRGLCTLDTDLQLRYTNLMNINNCLLFLTKLRNLINAIMQIDVQKK